MNFWKHTRKPVALIPAAPHPADCPCLDDRRPARWCARCETHGSHHTDRHDEMHKPGAPGFGPEED